MFREALGVTLVKPLIEAGHLQQGPVESVSLKHGVASSFRGLYFAPPEVTHTPDFIRLFEFCQSTSIRV